MFQAAKSTISDDVVIIKDIFNKFKLGDIETVVGAAGELDIYLELFEERILILFRIYAINSLGTRQDPSGRIFIHVRHTLYARRSTEIWRDVGYPVQHTNPDFCNNR